jgi:hypothetical protein
LLSKFIEALKRKFSLENNVVVTEATVYKIQRKATQRIVTDTKNLGDEWTKAEDQ